MMIARIMMMMMVIAEESVQRLSKIGVESEKAIPLLLKC